MYFNVSKLLREPSGSSRVFEIDDEWGSVSGSQAQRVRGTASMLRTVDGVWVSAALDSTARSTCSRCLTEYAQPVHMAIEEEFLPIVGPNNGARAVGPGDGQESFRIDGDHILDLTEAVGQYYALGRPMKPVCREECKGICATCGANLNETSCRCDTTTRDVWWSALRDLITFSESNEVHRS